MAAKLFKKNIPLTNKDIGEAFIALNKENPILYDYAKTFYWTLLKYFGAYQALNTGVVNGNSGTAAAQYNSLVMTGITSVNWLANNVITNLPIVGQIVGYIDSIVDSIFQEQNSRRFDNRVVAINKIISFNRDPNAQIEETFNLCIALTGIQIAWAKKDKIISPISKEKRQESLSDDLNEARKWYNDEISMLKDKLYLEKKIEIYHSQGSDLALRDIGLLVSYLYKHSDEIIQNDNNSLPEQFTRIVLEDEHERVLKQVSKENLMELRKRNQVSTSCCQIQ